MPEGVREDRLCLQLLGHPGEEDSQLSRQDLWTPPDLGEGAEADLPIIAAVGWAWSNTCCNAVLVGMGLGDKALAQHA